VDARFSGDDGGLKRNEDLMEKKIKRTQKGKKSGSYSSEEKTVILTVVVALVIMSAVLVYMVFFSPVQKQPFTSMYLLDSEKQLENSPETVVLGENSTFTVWVGVENHNDTTLDYSVQVNLDDGNTEETIECFNKTLTNNETWETEVTITIEEPGNNKLTFELLFFDETENCWNQTGNWIELSIEAVEAT
jgi:uncharacterized membrane protein